MNSPAFGQSGATQSGVFRAGSGDDRPFPEGKLRSASVGCRET